MDLRQECQFLLDYASFNFFVLFPGPALSIPSNNRSTNLATMYIEGVGAMYICTYPLNI